MTTNIFEKDTQFKRQHTINLLGPILLFGALAFVMPIDNFSTGLWFDNQGWNMVLNSKIDIATLPIVFLDFLVAGQVSVEGLVFSIMLTLVQFLMTAMIYEAGPWVQNDRIGLVPAVWRILRRDIPASRINASKWAALAVWIMLVIFDG